MSAEAEIRELIATWMRASATGDVMTLSELMAVDVVFLVPGQPPMRGRETFLKSFQSLLPKFRIEGASDVQEIQVIGDWAYCWTQLSVTMTPVNGGSRSRRSGNTLTILRREPNGHWVIFRDANLLTADS
jgi:uncharacterized protein (TIGR02246 family)